MDRHPQPPSTNSSTGGNNLPQALVLDSGKAPLRRAFFSTVNSNAPNPRGRVAQWAIEGGTSERGSKMERQDTVCKFCGVSYLVFGEIKELEKRLEDSEGKIQQYSKRLKDFDKLRRQLETLQETQKTAQKNQLAILKKNGSRGLMHCQQKLKCWK